MTQLVEIVKRDYKHEWLALTFVVVFPQDTNLSAQTIG